MSDKLDATEWIAVDYRPTHVRVWAMGAGGTVLERIDAKTNLATFQYEEIASALALLVGHYFRNGQVLPVIVSGLPADRIDHYSTVPCKPPTSQEAVTISTDVRMKVFLVPGVYQAKPVDLMSGAAIKIAGYLAARPDFDGVVLLVDTHSKWVRVSAGEIVSFQTFMTKEVLSLLSDSPTLIDAVSSLKIDTDDFAKSVSDALSRPELFGLRLFGIHALSVTGPAPSSHGYGVLAGLLMGLELAGARSYWLGQEIVIAAESGFADLYQTALLDQGVGATTVNAEDLTLAGLTAAYKDMKENK